MRIRRLGRLGLFAILATSAVLFGGCRRKDAKPAGDRAKKSVAGPKVHSIPVSEAEAEELARSLIKAAQGGSIVAFGRLFDWDALLERTMSGIDADKTLIDSFGIGLKIGWTKSGSIGELAVKTCKEGGSFALVRVRMRDHHRSAVFRIEPADGGGMIYVEFILSRRSDDRVKIVDMYSFSTGDYLSTTSRRFFVESFASSNRSLLERLTGSERELAKHQSEIVEMVRLVRSGEKEEAINVIDRLPEGVKKTRFVLLMRLQACQGVDETQYNATVDQFRPLFPDDPALDVMSIDYHTARKEYSKAIASVDRLDRSIGGDSHLELQRAAIHFLAGDHDAAKGDLDRLIKQEPESLDAYWTLASYSLPAKRYEETLSQLKILKTKFFLEDADLKKISEDPGFVASPQHKEWLLWLEAESKNAPPGG